MSDLPLLIEPGELQQHLDDDNLLIVDLCSQKQYLQLHIPGAVHLDYSHLAHTHATEYGLLPDVDQLSNALSAIGLDDNKQVVAYDEEGGGKAARLLWTLDVIGHSKAALLNGGIISWYREEFPCNGDLPDIRTSDYRVEYRHPEYVISAEQIMSQLNDQNCQLLDARSLEEYTGAKRFSARGGHIPGAIHFEWTQALDPQRNYRLLEKAQIQEMLDTCGFDKGKQVSVYCQTHHRSAFSYFMLKHMGFENARGYSGSWAEWGNRSDTPVE